MKRKNYKGKYRKSIYITYEHQAKADIIIYSICEKVIYDFFGFNIKDIL